MTVSTLRQLCLSIVLALSALTLTWTTLAHAGEPGDLDTGFGGTGVVTKSISSGCDSGFSVAIQPNDGKILVSGIADNSGNTDSFALLRFNKDGSLDTNLNNTGIVTTPISAYANNGFSVAVQPDDKIVVAGASGFSEAGPYFAVARYTITGALDTDFNGTGIVTTSIQGDRDGGLSVVIQPDGKIIVSGTGGSEDSIGAPIGDFAVARYNADGSLDTTFNGTGIVTTSINNDTSQGWSVAIQEDGNIVVAGFVCDFDAATGCDFAIARYLGSFTTHIPIILKEQ